MPPSDEDRDERPIEPAPRRHRALTVPSGLMLFVCMFLPAVRGCDEPIYPVASPPLYLPYLFGLGVAVVAWIRIPRTLAAWRGDRRLAVVTAIVAGCCTAWFALFLAEGLVGLYLSLASSIWLVVGAIVWRVDRRAPRPCLPRATLHPRRSRPTLVPMLVALMIASFAGVLSWAPRWQPPAELDLSKLYGC